VPPRRVGLARFVRECRLELKRVAWPTRDQTLRNGRVVLIAVVAATAGIATADLALGHLVGSLLR